MKIKTWVVWLVVVVFLVSEIMLFSASRQKDTALVSLHAEQERAAQLQAKVDELQNSNSSSQAAEIARLRADNLDLPRLRNQVTQLQAQNQKLSQQLHVTLSAAQQQQAHLEQVAAENQQVRQFDAAKQQWALEHNKTADALPTEQDIAPYIKLDANGYLPKCPSGGTYTLNAVGELPSCSVPGHVLPQ